MTAVRTGLRGISLVCVGTVDQDRAIEFYESLGFEKRVDTPFGGDYRWIEVYLPESQTGIALSPPPPGQPVVPGQTGITLTTDDVDATHAAMKAAGVDVDAAVSRMGEPVPPMFWFRDPSGHTLMVGRAELTTSPDNAELDFAALVELHRAELHAHCYRMLGSVHDADDAVQEALIRAWRAAASVRDARAARSWLYAIATNVCLTEIERRQRRGLPQDFGPASEGTIPPGAPITESSWLEPYPDPAGGLTPGKATPEARYEQLESVELAFVAAVQHLGPNQRAVLMLRDVLGFSAQEAAEMLETSVASTNSALQRARASVAEKTPERSQQTTLRSLGEASLQSLVDRWIRAWQHNDVASFAALLAHDASFSMPPLAIWYQGRDDVTEWARRYSINGQWRWKALLTRANSQPALAFYSWYDAEAAYLPFAMNVLTLGVDGLVRDVTAFIVRTPQEDEQPDHRNFPDRPVLRRFSQMYARFGLPERLTD